MQQAIEGASKLSGDIGMEGKAFQRRDRRSNSGGAQGATAEDLLRPIRRS